MIGSMEKMEINKAKLNTEQKMKYLELREHMDQVIKNTLDIVENVRQFEEDNGILWEEDKQAVADIFCLLLQMTRAGGMSNHVKQMRYEEKENGDEIITPVLADGNANWYKINVTGDSGVAMIKDITNQFVGKAW